MTKPVTRRQIALTQDSAYTGHVDCQVHRDRKQNGGRQALGGPCFRGTVLVWEDEKLLERTVGKVLSASVFSAAEWCT